MKDGARCKKVRCSAALRTPAWFLALLLAGVITQASVYVKWNSASAGGAALGALGGRLLYESSVQLNGSRGTLQAYGFEGGFREICANVGRACGLADDFTGRQMAMGVVEGDDLSTRLLALTVEPERVLIFCLATPTQAPVLLGWPDAIPQPGGAVADLHAVLDKSGTELLVSSIAMNPAEASAWLGQAMTDEGWSLVGGGGSIWSFEMEGRVCWVTVVEEGLHSRLTFLYRSSTNP